MQHPAEGQPSQGGVVYCAVAWWHGSVVALRGGIAWWHGSVVHCVVHCVVCIGRTGERFVSPGRTDEPPHPILAGETAGACGADHAGISVSGVVCSTENTGPGSSGEQHELMGEEGARGRALPFAAEGAVPSGAGALGWGSGGGPWSIHRASRSHTKPAHTAMSSTPPIGRASIRSAINGTCATDGATLSAGTHSRGSFVIPIGMRSETKRLTSILPNNW